MALSLKRSMFWSFLEQGGSKGVAVVVQILLARLLTPEAFGVMAILLVVTNIADSIAQSGLGLALIQEQTVTDKAFATAFWLSLLLALLLYTAIFFLAALIASFYGMPSLEGYLKILAIIVFINSINSILRSYLQREMDFKTLFKCSFLAVVISGAFGVLSAFLGFGIWSLIIQVLSQSLVLCVGMFALISWRPSFIFDTGQARSLFTYGWKICITGILNVLYSGVSELVIGKSCSPQALGIYSQGRKYPQAAIGIMTNAVSNVLFPAFSALKSNKDEFRNALRKALYAGTFVVAPVSFFFAAAAEPLVDLLLTEKWAPCVPIFQLTCLSNAFLMFQLVNLRAYMALGDSLLYMQLQIIKVVFGGGVICAAAVITADIYATAVAACLVGLMSILIVDSFPAKRKYGYGASSQFRDQIPVYALCGISFAVAYSLTLVALPYLLMLLIQIFIFFGIYLAASALLRLKGFSICKQALFGAS